MLLLSIAFLVLLAAIPTGAVHYRGLVRRTHGLRPGLQEPGWSLRDSLYVTIVLLVGSAAVLYVFAYDYLSTLLFDYYIDESVLTDINSPFLLVAQTATMAVLLLPCFFQGIESPPSVAKTGLCGSVLASVSGFRSSSGFSP